MKFNCWLNLFIDYLIAINDDGEFGRTFTEIYLEELELRLEYQGTHPSIVNIMISSFNLCFCFLFFCAALIYLFTFGVGGLSRKILFMSLQN